MESLTKAQSDLLDNIKNFDYIRINSSAHSPLATLVRHTPKGTEYKNVAYTTSTSLLRKDRLEKVKIEGMYITHYKVKEAINE
jgi:hypothetical protein